MQHKSYNSKKLKEYLSGIVASAVIEEGLISGPEENMFVMAIRSNHIPLQEVIRFILEKYLSVMVDYKPFEKTRWYAFIDYKGYHFRVGHHKFGYKLIGYMSDPDDKIIAETAKDLIGKFAKAVSLIETNYVKPNLEELITRGEIVIENHYILLRDMYEHFESTARDYLVEKPGADSLSKIARMFEGKREAFFNSVSAVNFYFSMLEHLFVIGVPFVEGVKVTGNVRYWLVTPWQKKFFQILGKTSESKEIYNKLVSLSAWNMATGRMLSYTRE